MNPYDLNEAAGRRRRAEDRLAEAEVARQFREKYDNERNAELAALRQRLEQAENRERQALTEIKTLRDEKAALEQKLEGATTMVACRKCSMGVKARDAVVGLCRGCAEARVGELLGLLRECQNTIRQGAANGGAYPCSVIDRIDAALEEGGKDD